MKRCFFSFRSLCGPFFGSLSGSFIFLSLLLLAALLLTACAALPQAARIASSPTSSQPYWPTQAWRSATPEEQGLDSTKLADALLTIRERGITAHSLLIIRNGRVLSDATFYPYDGKAVHEVASVTKSIMTTLIGIAADQGKLSLDDPMLSFFPDRTIANRDARKEAITVRHLSSMSSGLDCTAEGDERTLKEMRVTEDWVQFALDRPVRCEPGKQFVYCSPAIHLLSPILQQATGMTALEFARRYLFEPLGIRDVMWLTDPQGFNRGSEGIYLHPQDMARLGYLWLNGGAWDGKQIVSRDGWRMRSSRTCKRATTRPMATASGWIRRRATLTPLGVAASASRSAQPRASSSSRPAAASTWTTSNRCWWPLSVTWRNH